MISSFVSGLRSRMRRQIQKNTSKLEPSVRDELVWEVRNGLQHDARTNDDDENGDTASVDASMQLEQLEEELEIAKEQLQQSEERQQFVETRLFKYKRLLQDMQYQTKDDDAQHKEQQQNLLQALQTIEGNHKAMLAQMERMKRRIQRMEGQRDDMTRQLQECHDFLEAAGNVHVEEEHASLVHEDVDRIELVEMRSSTPVSDHGEVDIETQAGEAKEEALEEAMEEQGESNEADQLLEAA